MNNFPIIATFGYDFNLTGWPVWAAVAVGILVAAFSTPLIRLTERTKVCIRVLAPVVMLSALWITRWLDNYNSPFFFYKYYHAQLDVAYVVTYAFGLAFCVDLIRATQKAVRIFGVLTILIYLGLVPLMVKYVRSMDHWYEIRP